MTYKKTDDRMLIVLRNERKAVDHNEDMEMYRSGHNEAVLKTVCPQGRVGSNPTLSVIKKVSKAFWRSTQVAEGAPLERE